MNDEIVLEIRKRQEKDGISMAGSVKIRKHEIPLSILTLLEALNTISGRLIKEMLENLEG